uniref:Ig-like domain-containing protein n=1 Tax=Oncorhynchus kisutch TaxID=8019 RepID=A0A8C7CAT0_ONCKI
MRRGMCSSLILIKKTLKPYTKTINEITTKVMSVGLQMSCLVFGFNPRHTNLTLLRDGQLKAEQEMTGGQKRLEVITEELRERHNYTCTVSHLSLDNKLDVSWEPDPDRDSQLTLPFSSSVNELMSGGDVLLAQGQNHNSPTLLKCKSAY